MPRNEMLGIRPFDEASKPKADTPTTTVKPPVQELEHHNIAASATPTESRASSASSPATPNIES